MGKYSIKVKLAVPIIAIAILVLGFMTFMIARESQEMAKHDAEAMTRGVAKSYANEMSSYIGEALSVSRAFAQTLEGNKSHGFVSRDLVNAQLEKLLVNNKQLIGTWTGWESGAWDQKDGEYVGKTGHDQTGRFVPYWNYESGKPTLTPLIDYDKQGAGDYYLIPMARQKETVVEPYEYPIGGVNVLMTSAVVPVIVNGKAQGVVGVDVALKDIQGMASKIKPFDTSVAYVVSYSGNWVSHTDDKLITKPAQFPVEHEKFKSAIAKGEEVIVNGIDPADGVEYMFVMTPIRIGHSEQPWALFVKTPTSTVLAAAKSMLFFQLMIAGFGVLVLLAAVVLIASYISKKVSELSGKLRHSGEQVAGAISQLSVAGQSLSQSSSASAASLEETVASLEEMTSMVKMNSDNAKQAAALSAASSEAAVQGEKEMSELIASMSEISDSSKKIEEIINVIDDIAFQTNLLALNAAVEAARAGEQGKGFAVVAEAVRSLAQRSAEAAKDITSLIQESVAKIERGTHKADKSGEVLKNIVVSVKKVADLNTEIATASEEQSTGIGQISKAMNQLDQAVQSNAASSEEIAGTSDEINTQAQLMKSVVDELNVVVYGHTESQSHHFEKAHEPKFDRHKKSEDEDDFFKKSA